MRSLAIDVGDIQEFVLMAVYFITIQRNKLIFRYDIDNMLNLDNLCLFYYKYISIYDS